MSHITSNLIMIRPKHFNYNIETAENNHFQKKINKIPYSEIKRQSISEFNNLVQNLKYKKISVDVFDDLDENQTTDSVFPNNWFSLHENGNMYLYPMFSKNRRKERRYDIIENLKKRYRLDKVIDFSYYEKENKFLEGTGSMVLDRKYKICYASISQRTDKEILDNFCNDLGYKSVEFKSYQSISKKRKLIYHTNVIMNIGLNYAIICLESIDNQKERNNIIKSLEETEKEIIEISESQVHSFAGNMLQIKNKENKKFLVMSKSAYKSLNKKQIELIEYHNEIIYSELTTIETLGGGSARCMIAENFLEKK